MMINGGNEHITIKYPISTNTDKLKKSLYQLMMDMNDINISSCIP